MRLIVDKFVNQARPDLRTLATETSPKVDFHSFEWALEFPAITEVLEEYRPDVMVVDTYAFVVAAHLFKTLNADQLQRTKCVIGTTNLNNVVKVKASYLGFFDVVDLLSPTDEIIDRLRDINSGRSLLLIDVLWKHVTKPNFKANINLAPVDDADVEILELICIGLADIDIASATYMSHQSVRNCISRMLSRCGVSNRTQMAWLYKESQRTVALARRFE